MEQHITVESVNNHLRSQGITFSHDVQDLIAEGRRLFAILVLLEREHEVDAIFSRIQDDNLHKRGNSANTCKVYGPNLCFLGTIKRISLPNSSSKNPCRCFQAR